MYCPREGRVRGQYIKWLRIHRGKEEFTKYVKVCFVSTICITRKKALALRCIWYFEMYSSSLFCKPNVRVNYAINPGYRDCVHEDMHGVRMVEC